MEELNKNDAPPVYLCNEPVGVFSQDRRLEVQNAFRLAKEGHVPHHFRGQAGEDIVLVSSDTMPGGKEYGFSDGTKEIVHRDKSIEVDFRGGSHFRGKFDKDGNWREHHWTDSYLDNADGSLRNYDSVSYHNGDLSFILPGKHQGINIHPSLESGKRQYKIENWELQSTRTETTYRIETTLLSQVRGQLYYHRDMGVTTQKRKPYLP